MDFNKTPLAVEIEAAARELAATKQSRYGIESMEYFNLSSSVFIFTLGCKVGCYRDVHHVIMPDDLKIVAVWYFRAISC